ncbi:MAG: hypothetical protein AAF098_13375 [Pseudomonadota bacterium]
MPIARFEMPDGRVAKFEVPDGATPEQAQAQIQSMYEQGAFESQGPATDGLVDNSGNDRGDSDRSIQGRVLGGLEAAGTVASSVVAEPLAGLAGIGALLPGGRSPTEAIEATRNTLRYEPRTEEGQDALRATAGFMAPIGEAFEKAESAIGDTVFEVTGSPTLAAAATTFPALVLEAAGIGGVKAVRNARAARQTNRVNSKADELLQDAAPSRDQLRDVSNGLYREIDQLGATVNPNAFRVLAFEVKDATRKKGLRQRLSPETSGLVDEMFARANSRQPMSLEELSEIREVAKNVASNLTDKREAMFGGMVVDRLDDFMNRPNVLRAEDGADVGRQVSARYGTARKLWRRMRSSELIGEAMDKARNQASGYENGLRVQFRAILNNQKKSRFFSAEEKAAMAQVVQGSKNANLLKLLGKFGFGEQQATNMLGGSISSSAGAALGNAVAGTPGAIVGAATMAGGGSLARRAATRATEHAANSADQIVRQGPNGQDIARQYVRETAEPTPEGLAELLLETGAEIPPTAPLDEFTRKAAQIAARRRAELAVAAGIGSTERGTRENVVPFAMGAR